MKRKNIFLAIFVVAVIIILNSTHIAMRGINADISVVMMQVTDIRVAVTLVAVFGLVGYFVEVASERMKK